MKILLTGFSGFLGRHIADALLKQGHSLRIMLHKHTLTRREYASLGDVEAIWGTFNQPEVVQQAVAGVDCVIHSGWAFSPATAQRPTINERGSQLLFEESVKAGVEKFIFLSSVAVYGMGGSGIGIVSEQTELASGQQAAFMYPAEKTGLETWLNNYDRQHTALLIYRPGPIFDERKGPAKKVIKIGPWRFGLNFGTGQNHMAYVHVKDCADAVVRGVVQGTDGAVFNIVPSQQLLFKDWIRVWGRRKGLDIKPLFVPAILLRIAGWGVKQLKKLLGKPNNTDVEYVIAAATRDMVYSNERLKQALGWNDTHTAEYTRLS